MEDGEEVDPADDREGFEGDEGEEEERGGARGEREASVRNEAGDLVACEESVSKVGVGEEVGVHESPRRPAHLRLPRGRSTE